MSRTLDRSIARHLYAKFAADWRKELRKTGLYGTPKSPKRPTFAQWYALHEKDQGMLQESTAQDVMEYLEQDPWAETRVESSESDTDGERGVVTIPIAGDDE